MKQRVTKLTKNAADKFWRNKKNFYIVPRYTKSLSRGVLVDEQFFLRCSTLEEAKEICRNQFHTWFLDYYMIY